MSKEYQRFLRIGAARNVFGQNTQKYFKKHIGLLLKLMTEENFFDMFNRVHNPDYYYGRKKYEKKKTKEKKENRKPKRKPYPVFKVSD